MLFCFHHIGWNSLHSIFLFQHFFSLCVCRIAYFWYLFSYCLLLVIRRLIVDFNYLFSEIKERLMCTLHLCAISFIFCFSLSFPVFMILRQKIYSSHPQCMEKKKSKRVSVHNCDESCFENEVCKREREEKIKPSLVSLHVNVTCYYWVGHGRDERVTVAFMDTTRPRLCSGGSVLRWRVGIAWWR